MKSEKVVVVPAKTVHNFVFYGKNIVVIPMKTVHNVEVGVAKAIGKEFSIFTLLDESIIDFSGDWISKIKQKVVDFVKNSSSKDVYFVIVGHPIVNFTALYYLYHYLKFPIKVLYWDSFKDKYNIVVYPFENGVS
jgi:hypothetical protein